jgi:cell division protein FtsI/penicillin-binding protein 2
MQTVLSKSLNTGVAFVVGKLGKDSFREYMINFGLTEKTNIDLPNEALNITKNLNSPRTIEYITASYGQGIALTPVSTVRALSTLANGGLLVSPHVVKEIRYKTGLSKKIDFDEPKRVLKKETADEVTRMLIKVVDESLLNGKEKNPHYSIAAKTGTAQIASPDGKGYYSDRYLHSFFGYLPANNPKFLIFLYTVNPKGVEFAANTLAEPFFDLTKFLINYYNLTPDR